MARRAPLAVASRSSTRSGSRLDVAFGRTGNEARTAAKGQIFKSPLHEDQHATLKLDDVHQVNKQPDEPGRPAPKIKPKNVGNGRGASDDRHVALVEVPKWPQV